MDTAVKISGTGTGTNYPAATDIAKENGTTIFGGTQLIDDPMDPQYQGHGVGHRDPKTGQAVDAHTHIPARGETHPEEFAVAQVDSKEQNSSDILLTKYGVSSPSKYHANWYKTLGILNGMMGKMSGRQKFLEKATRQRDLGSLEMKAFEEAHGGFTFAKDHKK